VDLKPKAREFLKAVNTYDRDSIRCLVHPDYIQHNPKVPTGREAFIRLLGHLRDAQSRIENLKMYQEGRFVFMQHIWHNAQPFGFDLMSVSFHVIRFDDSNLIAEHWSVMAACDRELAESLRTAHVDGSGVPNVENSRNALWDLKVHGPDASMAINELYSNQCNLKIQKIHRIFKDGDVCLIVIEGTIKNKPCALYQMCQIQKPRRIEHFGIWQPVPEIVANANTMFGFE
jgi:predicted SnoaL-like aldol condensation-catalyzing enzyme